MKVALIEATCPDIRAYGVRCISSYLKANGQNTRLIFIPPETELVRFKTGQVFQYNPNILADTAELCADCDYIGISFMSYYYDRTVQLTNYLKKHLNKPIIWGGVHATVRPAESLEHCDIACTGEGEGALLELMQRAENGDDIYATRNMWFRKPNGEIISNDRRPLIQDLDSINAPDWDISDHHAFDPETNHVVRMNERLVKHYMKQGPLSPLGEIYHYKTMASRGCPHNCNFCSVSTYRTMYEGEKFLRWQSFEHIIAELKGIRERFPFVNAFTFFDDSLLATSAKNLGEFFGMYKKEIGLPFAGQVSPTTVTEEKVQILVDAGMHYVEMGVQSGSDEENENYNRKMPRKKVLEAAHILNKYRDQMLPPDYHLILDNPWATEKDNLATITLGLELPKPYHLKPSSLIFYPGTEIYERAKRDGFIDDDLKDVYRKAFGAPKPTYMNFLVFCLDFQYVPRTLLRQMVRPGLVKMLNRDNLQPMWVGATMGLSVASMLGRGLYALLTGDLGRVKRAIKHRLGGNTLFGPSMAIRATHI